jgi:hypothetical protein
MRLDDKMQQYRCPNPACSAQVTFGMRFCSNCGFQLNWSTQQPPPPQYQQLHKPVKSLQDTSRTAIAGYITGGMLLILITNELASYGKETAIPIIVVQCIGIGLSLIGGYLWAKLKGRHWAWMFTMLAVWVGVLVLPILKDRNQGKNTWVITGAVFLLFLVIVAGRVFLGETKFWNTIIITSIGWLPIIIIAGLVVLGIELANRGKKKF